MTTLRRSLAHVLAATALVGAAVALPAAPASAASTCTTDCITAASITADTKTIRVQATTRGSTHTIAEVWKVDRSVRVSTLSVTADGYWDTAFAFASTSSLTQNSSYAVKLVATDMLGKTRTEWLGVRVKQRTSTWYIDRINVSDDSDAAGAGEFNGAWKVGTAVKTPIWSGWQSKSSGGYWTFSAANASTHTTVSKQTSRPAVFLQLVDDDNDVSDFGCGTTFGPTWQTVSTDCADSSTAGAYVTLPEKSATTSFTLYVNKTAPVQLTVVGHVVSTVS